MGDDGADGVGFEAVDDDFDDAHLGERGECNAPLLLLLSRLVGLECEAARCSRDADAMFVDH